MAINASDSTSGINICANLCSDALTSNLGFITFLINIKIKNQFLMQIIYAVLAIPVVQLENAQ